MKPTKECIKWFDKQGYKLQFARNQDRTTIQPWNFLKKKDDGFGGLRIKELGLEQAQEIYNSVQKEKVEKQKAVSENEKIREMLNDPEVIGKAVKGAIKAQRKMAGLESEEK